MRNIWLFAIFFLSTAVFSEERKFTLQWERESASSSEWINFTLAPGALITALGEIGIKEEVVATCSKGLWGGFSGYELAPHFKLGKDVRYWIVSCEKIDLDSTGVQSCKAQEHSGYQRAPRARPIEMEEISSELVVPLIESLGDGPLFLGGERLQLKNLSLDGTSTLRATFAGCHCVSYRRYEVEFIESTIRLTEEFDERKEFCI